MRNDCVRGMRFVLMLLGQSAPPQATQAQGLLGAPVINGKPVEVAIGFYAYDFARVTSRDESFDLTGYLRTELRDPRLELPADARAATKDWRRMDAARVWTPKVYFETRSSSPGSMPIRSSRLIPKAWSQAGRSSAASSRRRLHLERFPFDRQRLAVRIGAFEDESVMKF